MISSLLIETAPYQNRWYQLRMLEQIKIFHDNSWKNILYTLDKSQTFILNKPYYIFLVLQIFIATLPVVYARKPRLSI